MNKKNIIKEKKKLPIDPLTLECVIALSMYRDQRSLWEGLPNTKKIFNNLKRKKKELFTVLNFSEFCWAKYLFRTGHLPI